MGMEIKKLADTEKMGAMPLVWRVFLEFEAPGYAQEGVDTFWDFISSRDEIGRLDVWGAYEGEKLVGVLAARNSRSHIALFFVGRDYHRRGVGRGLFETFLTQSDAEKITVNSSPYAVEIYQRLGFAATAAEQTTNGIRYVPMQFFRPCGLSEG
jgi:GNAT superfamily N-acetyltransferase